MCYGGSEYTKNVLPQTPGWQWESEQKMEGKRGRQGTGKEGKGRENTPKIKFLVMALVAVYIAGRWS